MIPKNMISSPLGCCITTADRQNLNPVFKQQYVTEAGQIKMKMPISPMHYITNANFYAHDDRFPVRLDHNYAYYNERVHHNTRNVEHEYKADVNKRIITPTVSFITQPRRNLSAHAVDPGRANSANMNYILRNIDEKLSRIEFICKNNEQEIREIIHMLRPKPEATNKNNNTRLVPKENYEGSMNKNECLGNSEFESFKKHDNGMGDRFEMNRVQISQKNDIYDHTSSKPARLLSQSSLGNLSPELLSKVDSAMFEVPEDLKNSNDILENYIRNMKFEELTDMENKLDVLSGDFASVSICNNTDEAEREKCEEASVLSNIESKFKKLFTGFGSKAPNEHSDADEPKQTQPAQFNNERAEESLAVFESSPSNAANHKKNALGTPTSSSDQLTNGISDLNSAATSPNDSKGCFRSEDLKLPSKKFKPSSPESFINPTIQLTDTDMISILKGIDLQSKIKEANLTAEELMFLKGLNKCAEAPATDLDPSGTSSSAHANEQSELSDGDFKCDLVAPTRVDFGPLLRDDSIHALNSISFD